METPIINYVYYNYYTIKRVKVWNLKFKKSKKIKSEINWIDRVGI